jgi:hypothetical protein
VARREYKHDPDSVLSKQAFSNILGILLISIDGFRKEFEQVGLRDDVKIHNTQPHVFTIQIATDLDHTPKKKMRFSTLLFPPLAHLTLATLSTSEATSYRYEWRSTVGRKLSNNDNDAKGLFNKARNWGKHAADRVTGATTKSGYDKTKDAASGAYRNTKDAASSVKDKTKDVACSAKDKTKGVASSAYDKIRGVFKRDKGPVDNAASKVKNTARNVAKKVQEKSKNVKDALKK